MPCCLPDSRCACGLSNAVQNPAPAVTGVLQRLMAPFKQTVLGSVLCEGCCNGQDDYRGARDGQGSKLACAAHLEVRCHSVT